jgi:hypothetical protein
LSQIYRLKKIKKLNKKTSKVKRKFIVLKSKEMINTEGIECVYLNSEFLNDDVKTAVSLDLEK